MVSIAFVIDVADSPGLFVHQYNFRILELIPFLHVSTCLSFARRHESGLIECVGKQKTFIAGVIFGPALALIKSAILLEWIRIFTPPGVRNLTFWSCQLLLWVNLIFYALMVILLCIECTPMEAIWNPLVPGRCRVNITWTELTSSVVNFATDLLILLIPQRVIWTLNMAKERKAGVAAVFAIGLLGIIATGIRVYYTSFVTTDKDYTYTFSRVMLCALAEGTCAVIVVCGTTMPRAATAVFDSKLATSWRSFLSSQRSASGPSSSLAKSMWPSRRLDDKDSKQANASYSNLDEHNLVPLNNVVWTAHSNGSNEASRLETGAAGIVRKTQFETSEIYNIDGAMNDYERQRQSQRQHPWNDTTHQ